MQPLALPTFQYQLRYAGEHMLIFDAIRKQYVRLTPEEWVRQHWVRYLIDHLGYPAGLVSLERSVRCTHQLQHRPDIVVYDRTVKPQLLVECKAPNVTLNTDILGQLARYNTHLQAHTLVLSNGLQHFCWQINADQSTPQSLSRVPHFHEAISIGHH